MASIEKAAEKLSGRENRLEKIEEKFEDVEEIEEGPEISESFISKQIEKREPGKVAGIDGGVVKKRYSSGDLIAVRAVAAIFTFGEKLETDYLPEKSPEPEFEVFDAGDADSIDRNAETERLKQETSRVLGSLEEADTVLLDGSIVPSYLENEEVLENYNSIFEKAENGQLAGVVEDSYGLKMAVLMEDKLGIDIGKIRDTLLMDAILEEGERSFVRKYSDSPVEHPVLKKIDDRHANKLHTFYVKLSERDIPLRVDYFGAPEDADEIAGVLLSLKSSDSYTVPSPVVEADKRAKIPETYLKRFEKRFSPREKRRNRRML